MTDLPAGRARIEGAPTVALLVALSATAPLSIDMFLPSMPAMADEFRVSESTLQLAVTLFIVAFAGSQLFYGPASDRVGRRPMLLAGLGLFVAGGIIALFAQDAQMLIAGRIVQGLGGGAGPSLAQAIVLDIFGRERAARVIAYMSIALPLAPALAPIAGGFLHEAFGWRSVFVTLVAIGLALALGYRARLPETNAAAGVGRGGIAGLLADYRTVLTNRTTLGYALVMGLMFGGQLVFISSSSFVLIDELGLSPTVFGFSFAFVALGLMAGASVSSRLVGRVASPRIVRLGALTAVTSSAVMAGLAWGGVEHVLAILLPMFVTAMGFGLARPQAIASALVPFPQIAGLVSALLGFSQMLIASAFNIIYSQIVDPGVVALPTGILISVSGALLVILVVRPGRDLLAAR